MTDNVVSYELQKMHDTLTKIKHKKTLNFGKTRTRERFN